MEASEEPKAAAEPDLVPEPATGEVYQIVLEAEDGSETVADAVQTKDGQLQLLTTTTTTAEATQVPGDVQEDAEGVTYIQVEETAGVQEASEAMEEAAAESAPGEEGEAPPEEPAVVKEVEEAVEIPIQEGGSEEPLEPSDRMRH